MLLSMPSKKKKEEDINLSEDTLLGDILGQIKPKLPTTSSTLKKATLAKTSTPSGPALPRAQEERNPFLQRGTGLKKTVPVHPPAGGTLSKVVDTTGEPASQVIEEFESCPMEGFDEDMIMDDFSETFSLFFSTVLWIRIRIRIQWGPWIRIRIRNQDPDPGVQK
jgi:hypothetical protein